LEKFKMNTDRLLYTLVFTADVETVDLGFDQEVGELWEMTRDLINEKRNDVKMFQCEIQAAGVSLPDP
jgi:hypothetical protein